jgi:mRNA interferase RelE/StbE
MTKLYGFAYSRDALAFLKTLPAKQRRQIVTKIEALASDPFPAGAHRLVQGMKDGEDRVFRIRSGDYRVLYTVRDVSVVILDIGHRKDVYR